MTQKKYFASMTLNDTKIDLGFATFAIILQRIVSKQRSFSDLIETGQVSFAATKEGLATTESRSEEHTSELQSLIPISYAVFCLQTNNATHLPSNNLPFFNT